MSVFNESSYENSIIELFEDLGYTHVYGPDMTRDIKDPLMVDQLRSSLEIINPTLPSAAINEAIYKLRNYETGSLVSKNKVFMDYLQNGIQISYQEKGETKSTLVYLVNYENTAIENTAMNSFIVANQWTVTDYETKRPDIVIFLNGLPVVVMELKSPKADTVTIEDAYLQIRNYLKSIQSFFIYNAFCVISDQSQTRAGTITASFDRYMEWKTVNGDYEETRYADFSTLIKGMFTNISSATCDISSSRNTTQYKCDYCADKTRKFASVPSTINSIPVSLSSGMELQKSLYFSISLEGAELLLRKQREGERFFIRLDLFDVKGNKYMSQPYEIALCFYGDSNIL